VAWQSFDVGSRYFEEILFYLKKKQKQKQKKKKNEEFIKPIECSYVLVECE